ncbi:MAG: glycosyltransferase family 39 protein [Pseudomonadota bacterium]
MEDGLSFHVDKSTKAPSFPTLVPARDPGRIALWCFVLISVAFAVGHAALRLSFDVALNPADSLEIIASQDLKPNYSPRQPPLYTWLMWGAVQVLGPGALAVQIVKYGLMSIAAIGFYTAGLAATKEHVRAAIGALSVLMLFNVGFTIHDQSTHSVALIAAIGLLCLGYAMLGRDARISGFVVIAVSGALAVLSKHSAWILLVAFPAAFLLQNSLRQRILSPKFLAAMATIVVAALPMILFLLVHRDETAGHLTGTFAMKPDESIWIGRLWAQAMLFGGALILLGPVALLLWLTFPEARFGWTSVVKKADVLTSVRALRPVPQAFVTAALIAFVVIVVGLIASGATKVPSRHLLVVAIPLTLALAWCLPLGSLNLRNFFRFAGIVVALQLALMASRAAGYAFPGKPFCKRCSQAMPVAALAERLDSLGLSHATLITEDRVPGANLRTFLPNLRVIYLVLPNWVAPKQVMAEATDDQAKCVYLGQGSKKPIWKAHNSFAPETLRAEVAKVTPIEFSAPWPQMLNGERRVSTWRIYPLPAELEVCQ